MDAENVATKGYPSKCAKDNPHTAIIIGAGPAGLTAAYELLKRTCVIPIVLEKSVYMGGLARTVNYKGNRIDFGGHRFFTKSDRVMDWWLRQMPLRENGEATVRIAYHGMHRDVVPTMTRSGPESGESERVMLLRKRKSRIYFTRQFFDYPLRLTGETLGKLGLLRIFRIGVSYLRSALLPIRPVQNLEQFFINRFGRELYRTFFKSYTEKVWGVPCSQISAEWGAQRIKGLSITKSVMHFLKQKFHKSADVAQKQMETSLIEQFLYPKLGPGQMWELVADEVRRMGGEIYTGLEVVKLRSDGNRILAVETTDDHGGQRTFSGDYFFSTMAVKDLLQSMGPIVPANVAEVGRGLPYRDFITVGLLVKRLKVSEKDQHTIEDNWIYIQEPEVLTGRLQIFNNWSPHLVSNPEHMWIGVEYFCYESDELWGKSDAEMAAFAARELESIDIIDQEDVLDAVVLRMTKSYPAYFGTYHRFEEIRKFTDSFDNLFLVGRNGMHKYNNQDHSMLTAMMAVDNIVAGRVDKSNLWGVNTEMEFHENEDKS
jgi:protoporphyrinogen oxidase